MRIISLILAAGLGLGCTAANAQLQVDPGSDSSEGTPWADLKAQAEAEKAVYEAQAEAAKAQQAVYEAQAAAMKAKFGNISGEGGTAGALTVDEDGNKPEGMLLVQHSTQIAAGDIFRQVRAGIVARPHQDVLIIDAPTDLYGAEALEFDLRVAEIGAALDAASEQYRHAVSEEAKAAPVDAGAADRGRAVGLAAAGALMDSVVKLGSYFRAEYAFAPIAGVEKEGAAMYAVAGRIATGIPGRRVFIADRLVQGDAVQTMAALRALGDRMTSAHGAAAHSKSRAAALAETHSALAGNYTLAEATATKAVELYTTFMTDMTTRQQLQAQQSVTDAPPKFWQVVKQKRIQRLLAGKPLVLLIEDEAAAQYYTKKGVWTFLTGPPLYTVGAVTIGFVLLDAESGQVYAAGNVARHGGYRTVRDVGKMFPSTSVPDGAATPGGAGGAR